MASIQSETDCYDIIEVLGKGTFGEVAKGWRRSTGQMVAIKVLRNDAHQSRIIKNELRLLRCMRELDPDEAHVIRFLDFFHDALKFYLVFELLEQNLFEYQKENNFAPLAVRHIRTVTLQVLRALARLKELAIIHADLKPENIMLVDQARCPFRVKVIDFGSASIFSEVRYVKEPYIQSRFYRAPEILLGLPFCEKVDMWSLGCVMAELHLGWPLYPGNSEFDQVRYICETQGPPKPHVLQAARKAHHFFKRNLHPEAASPWQLKSSADYLAETKVRPLERRKYVLKSLDQMETVNGGPSKLAFPDREALAEAADLKSMVELVKRMLTWESHERISPSAALRHPFVGLQQLRSAHEGTRYYQLSLHSCRASLYLEGRAPQPGPPGHPPGRDGACFWEERGPGVQRTIDQLDDLSLQEQGRLWGDGYGPPEPPAERPAAKVGGRRCHEPPEPILAFYGTRLGRHKPRKYSAGSKSDPNFGNLILLGQPSPKEGESGEHWQGVAPPQGRATPSRGPAQREGGGSLGDPGPLELELELEAERPGPEHYDSGSCPVALRVGKWVGESDKSLERERGRSHHHHQHHQHRPARGPSFLQRISGRP
ncbi:homeodomain-interacting protein kinase 4 [Ornithorhynchus anatinus]|uniref:non-specific serine/threonine protein kinase n=1 Tax=Ornithorhynchus anatinus TaxID=9258 RepID=F6USB0_ORNAN|nr:homeodomain-interacting protein kinase 4 [Ornithorhynchus anatinus]